MSRPPLRHLHRLVHSGLEKAALACAAFGLLHATAEADERRLVEVSLADPWSNPAAPAGHIDNAWGTYASRGVEADSGWTTPLAHRTAPCEHVAEIGPTPRRIDTRASRAAASMLANDRSDWNDVPRARSPGLIAANDAWRSRSISGANWNNAPVKAAVSTRVETPDTASSTDRRLAPRPGIPVASPPDAGTQRGVAVESAVWLPTIRGAVDSSTRLSTQSASSIGGEARKGDWSIFSGSARVISREQDAPVVSTDAPQPQSQTKTSPHAVMNDFLGMRPSMAMTPDGKWYPPSQETSTPTPGDSWTASAIQ
jgi:hypothetical protein